MLNNKIFYKCIFKFIFTTFFFTTMISSVAAYTDSDGHVFNFSYTYTPNESIIETRQYYEAAASVLDSYNQQAAQYITSQGWTSQYIRGATIKYNCHSYAWHSQAVNNINWINKLNRYNESNLSLYWTDNSYYLLTTDNWNIPSFVPDGAIVLYANDDHSAVKISATKLISKWGKAGLYEHKPTQAPYDSSLLKFYTIHPYQVSQHTSSSHKWICHECNDTLYESHKWANFGTRYRCSICGMISQNIVQ